MIKFQQKETHLPVYKYVYTHIGVKRERDDIKLDFFIECQPQMSMHFCE